jgi:hypothetical protein
VQTELTDTRRRHQGELERVNGQINTLTQQNQQLLQTKQDYDILEQLIDENPDLAEQLFERAGSLKPRAGQAARGAGGGQPATNGAPPELVQEVRQLRSMLEGQRAQETEAATNARLSNTDRELGESLKTLLREHELDESWLPSAREYVLAVARRIPTLDMSEVPYVFADWAKPLMERLNSQLNTWRNGKLMDQKTLPPSPTGGTMVTGQPARGALDRNTKSILEERLKSALGWRNE